MPLTGFTRVLGVVPHLVLIGATGLSAQSVIVPPGGAAVEVDSGNAGLPSTVNLDFLPNYRLGSDDHLSIRVGELDEFDPRTLGVITVDRRGNISLPLAGRIHAQGLTVEQLEIEIGRRLMPILREPEVTVTLAAFRSHPVSILGAVKSPGVHQVVGRRTLFEVLSMAGGLSADAGNSINIARRTDSGSLPLPGVTRDPSGAFFVGRLPIRTVMEAKNPGENIDVLPNDVITVPKADLVYVTGAVRRSGGFVLSEKEEISTLQALSLAEGLDRVAAPRNARILRQVVAGAERTEIPLDLRRILEGKAQDVALRANDILFIPTSAAKSAGLRALEAAIQAGTGVVIYRR